MPYCIQCERRFNARLNAGDVCRYCSSNKDVITSNDGMSPIVSNDNGLQINTSQHNTIIEIDIHNDDITCVNNVIIPPSKVNINSKEYELVDEHIINSINKSVDTVKKIRITEEDNITEYGIDAFKNMLMSTIDKLYNTIDFLQNEIMAQNLVIKDLLIKKTSNQIKSRNILEDIEINASSTDINILAESENPCIITSQPLRNVYSSSPLSKNDRNADISIDLSYIYDAGSLCNHVPIYTDLNKTLRNDIREPVSKQLSDYRIYSHTKFMQKKVSIHDNHPENIVSNYNNPVSHVIPEENIMIQPRSDHHWPTNTVLITGDSMLNGIQEERLNKNLNVKVRPFPGAKVNDMYDYIAPLLRKMPTYIILHIGCNDAQEKTSSEIFNDILRLKTHIETKLPTVEVYLSCPVIRVDSAKAGLTLCHLTRKMMTINAITNNNIDGTCLGKAGLHLNAKGTGRLAINFLSLMQRL